MIERFKSYVGSGWKGFIMNKQEIEIGSKSEVLRDKYSNKITCQLFDELIKVEKDSKLWVEHSRKSAEVA